MRLTHFVRTTRVFLAPYAPTLIGLAGALVFGLLCTNAGFYSVPRGMNEKTPSILSDLDFLRNRPANVAALIHDTAAAIRWAMAATLLVLGLLSVALVCLGAWLSTKSNNLRKKPSVMAIGLILFGVTAYSIGKISFGFHWRTRIREAINVDMGAYWRLSICTECHYGAQCFGNCRRSSWRSDSVFAFVDTGSKGP